MDKQKTYRMKHFILLALIIATLISCSKKDVDSKGKEPQQPTPVDSTIYINYNKDITVANWNIEWFGDAAMFGKDIQKQAVNAGKILKYLNADLYGLCEIVDTARFGNMIRANLSSEYKYIVYTTGANISSQKLAYVYNKNIFRNVSVRPFMGISTQAYYNFATRFPLLLTTDVTVNGTTKTVSFILFHAKANADKESYNRRLGGARELKDSLDAYYNAKNFMLIGDYNDNLNNSILIGKGSPYQVFLDDTSQYNAITQPLNVTGNQSTISYANSVIDQQIISKSMFRWYITSSAKIRTDVANVISDYQTGNTSDHYPITSVFRIAP